MMRRLLQLIIILIPVGLFVWLLVIDLAPSGTRQISYTVDQESPFVDRILPAERVEYGNRTNSGDAYTMLVDEPTYFAVHFPNTDFDRVKLTVAFDPGEQGIVEIGALVDAFSQAFDLRPLSNAIVENLSWHTVEQDGVTLLQRNPTFTSVDDFLQHLPPRSKIATYAYDLDVPYRLPDYTPRGSNQSIDVSLRGYQKFITYVKDEPVFLRATFMDMNREAGADDVRVTARDESGNIVFESTVRDDGNIDENQISSTRSVEMNQSGWSEGVYTVELSGTSDIFWRNIDTSLRYVSFVNQIYIGDDVGHLSGTRPTTFYTNAKNLTLETVHSESVQKLTIGSQQADLQQTHEKVRVHLNDVGVISGSSPVGDVKIIGDGKFAFSRDAFFDPDPVHIGVATDLDALDVDYVITSYSVPERVDGWDVASATFSIPAIKNEKNAGTFTISAPLIRDNGNEVRIHAIDVTFEKDPMTLGDVLRALRNLLPFGL